MSRGFLRRVATSSTGIFLVSTAHYNDLNVWHTTWYKGSPEILPNSVVNWGSSLVRSFIAEKNGKEAGKPKVASAEVDDVVDDFDDDFDMDGLWLIYDVAYHVYNHVTG